MVQKCISINQKFQSKHYPAGAMLEKKLPIPKKLRTYLCIFAQVEANYFSLLKEQ